MGHQLHADVNSAIARMEVDVAIVSELFGYAVARPSLLVAELAGDGDIDANACDGAAGDGWARRAARIIAPALTCNERAIRQCAEHGFGDRDARVRGLAWCLLTEVEDWPDTAPLITRGIAAAYDDYVAPASDPTEREGMSAHFELIMLSHVHVSIARQLTKVIEHEYIETHGGADRPLMESSLSAAIAFLEHPDSDRRLAAIQVVARAGRNNNQACDAIYQRATADSESEVRVVAIITYAQLFMATRDARWLSRIAPIVLDEDKPMYERFVAYQELHTVLGDGFCDRLPEGRVDPDKLGRLRDGIPDVDWPVPIDWDFVRRCARGGSTE